MKSPINDQIKINDLATLSGVSKSTIHHYLRSGLLHPPKKIGLSQSIYNSTHLRRLKRIRELRVNKKLPLTQINDILKDEFLSEGNAAESEEEALIIRALEDKKRNEKATKSNKKRVMIMDAAIAEFSRHGYEKTTLEAIAESLNMAKSTIYLYFKNKDDLFMECIDRLTYIAVPETSWDEIRRETDILNRIKKRAIAFHNAFPGYRGILTMTKAALGSDNLELAEKSKDTMKLITESVAKDIRRGIEAGVFREIDATFVSVLMVSMGEGIGFRSMIDPTLSGNKAVDDMFEFIAHALLKQHDTNTGKSSETWKAEITDSKGVISTVSGIKFNNKDFFPAKIGDASVELMFEKIASIEIQKTASDYKATIKTHEDGVINSEIDGEMMLTGEISLGLFSIQIKNITQIRFDPME